VKDGADDLAEQAASLFERTAARIVPGQDLSMAQFYEAIGTIRGLVRAAYVRGSATGAASGWDAHVAMVAERVRELAMSNAEFKDQPVPDCEPF